MSHTILENISKTFIISKSKFITYLFHVESKDNTLEILNKIEIEHRNSSHICYAYILDEKNYKFYDDREPSSTAGLPIYNSLKNHQLVYTLAIVVRYFGGKKMGVGPLARAYGGSINKTIKNCKKGPYYELEKYYVECEISKLDTIEKLIILGGGKLISRSFDEKAKILFEMEKVKFEKIIDEEYNLFINAKIKKDKV